MRTFAKVASARALLALAAAALAFAGCGGGSSTSPGTTSAGSAGSAVAAAGSGPAVKEGGQGPAGPQAGGSPSSGGGHSQPVPQPSGERAPTITPKQRREATVADIALESPVGLPSGGGVDALPAKYTCDGENTSPELRWHGVPAGTAELALLVMSLKPVDGKLFFDWAVAGLSPELEEIEAGKLPEGAVVGRNGFGKTAYEICPEGGGENYIFALFALPEKLSPSQGFEPFALRKAAAESSGNVGLLPLSYSRG